MTLISLIAAVSVLLASDAPVGPDAQKIFTQSIMQARSIHISPFLRYKYTIEMTHKQKAKKYSYLVLERLSDHLGRFTGLEQDGSESQDIHLHSTLVSPGLFLNAVAEEAAAVESDSGPATIGRSVVMPYTAVFATPETIGGCSDAFHILLTPLGQPEQRRLREIWVDPSTLRICHAKIHHTVNIISREAVTIDLSLDRNQFVEEWNFSGTGHTPVGTYTLSAVGQFMDVMNVPMAEDRLFK